MSVTINYSYYAECSETELVAKLERIHARAKKLPHQRITEIMHLDPIYVNLLMYQFKSEGFELPPEVAERVAMTKGDDLGDYRILLAPPFVMEMFEKLEEKFHHSANDCIKLHAKAWGIDRFPELFKKGNFPTPRKDIELNLAGAMIRHGYMFLVMPAKGCESVMIGLSTFRSEKTPVWFGCGFTKTQYAVPFVEAHETVCAILDFVKEEGLLHEVEDVCEYYEHRDWKKSAPIVNGETTFAKIAATAFAAALPKGARFEAPIFETHNIVHVEDDEPKKKKKKKE